MPGKSVCQPFKQPREPRASKKQSLSEVAAKYGTLVNQCLSFFIRETDPALTINCDNRRWVPKPDLDGRLFDDLGCDHLIYFNCVLNAGHQSSDERHPLILLCLNIPSANVAPQQEVAPPVIENNRTATTQNVTIGPHPIIVKLGSSEVFHRTHFLGVHD
ncbi:hypothetical protein GCM10016455_09170 [Aliiroseovarius zhejiangensis]|uniref:Uncharacterized protein n=1 Tax=Aliiroseovarius zhejiangensis TaxID=1632025 RepID=A0ABQ3ITQ7_9RHOB|nr:hypothetical protein GCM10016455_09170 [Aliiroseovarius zhejiangensis]